MRQYLTISKPPWINNEICNTPLGRKYIKVSYKYFLYSLGTLKQPRPDTAETRRPKYQKF